MTAEERYAVAPERLARWIERWEAAHGGVAEREADAASLTLVGADGAVARFEPPFPPLAGDLVEHVERERRVGVLLVRLGAHAAGVFAGRELVVSKVDRRLVHGRHRKGGSSARRFERRRGNQARDSLEAAAALAARLLVPEARTLDAFVTGGDRRALDEVLEDRRLAPLLARREARVLEVPEPRLEVLRATPDAFLATTVRLSASGRPGTSASSAA